MIRGKDRSFVHVACLFHDKDVMDIHVKVTVAV